MHPFALPLAVVSVSADVLYVALSAAFFGAAVVFAWFCEQVR